MAVAMAEPLTPRGPDAGDVWVDEQASIGLAHRRLSIIDLSSAGAQPMISQCGRYVIVYNGEIYNGDELRPEIMATGRTFRGHSDTEVVLEGCAAWGAKRTVERLNGMFAFALWDRRDQILTLARDRLGIKPLYWSFTDGLFLFGSELKAFRTHPRWSWTIDRNAVAAYLRHNYIPAPHSIYQTAQKLLPGCLLRYSPAGGEPVIESYWDLETAYREGKASLWQGDDEAAIDELESLLGDAVRRRMVADVPLGAFLSGGIDSSTVVALMQANSDRPVRTFTIGFDEAGYDESPHAEDIARHLGTEHTTLFVTSQEAREVIPQLPDIYDEPFADSSQIPTFAISRLTRDHVTVALSGDGGDELFAGYNRYVQAQLFARHLGRFPNFLRAAAASGIKGIPPLIWDRIFAMVPASRRPQLAGQKMHKLADVLTADGDSFYRRLISHWTDPNAMVSQATEPKGLVWDSSLRERVPDFVERMCFLDTLTYLPDDILTKVDRASMATSLEVRVPLLDHRVVEHSWRLPMRMKIRAGRSKWLLRQVLYRHVPANLVDRPKMGFGIPIGEWLRGPLREWAGDLLSPDSIKRFDLLDPAPITAAWDDHQTKRRDQQYLLWDVLMLQAWLHRHAC